MRYYATMTAEWKADEMAGGLKRMPDPERERAKSCLQVVEMFVIERPTDLCTSGERRHD